jgi:hypothetical protein
MQQAMQNEIPLHDIKPLLEIQDYSFYYFLALLFVVSVIIVGIIYLLYKHFRTKKRFNIRKEHNKILQKINLKETKKKQPMSSQSMVRHLKMTHHDT